jgi:hypothetical protein
MPLLFLSLVLEGIVKGFERFDAMRTFEVVAAMSYAALALLAVWGGHDENAVCYGLLISLMLRAAMAGTMAFQVLKGKGMLPSAASAADRSWFSTQTRAMGANKVLGSAQSQWPPLVVALLLGPTAVGVFDALSRLPRAVKGVLGLLSSTVLPLAARWLLSGVDLRPSAIDPDGWDSRFVSLHIETLPGTAQDTDESAWQAALSERANHWQASLNLEVGPITRLVLLRHAQPSRTRLLWVIHHLAVDGVSWRILMEDLQRA